MLTIYFAQTSTASLVFLFTSEQVGDNMELQVICALTNYSKTGTMDTRTPAEVERTIELARQFPTPIVESELTWQARIENPIYRAKYTVLQWHKQLLTGVAQTPACTWCGHPSGNWCDNCAKLDVLPARSICSTCEGTYFSCKPCKTGS